MERYENILMKVVFVVLVVLSVVGFIWSMTELSTYMGFLRELDSLGTIGSSVRDVLESPFSKFEDCVTTYGGLGLIGTFGFFMTDLIS